MDASEDQVVDMIKKIHATGGDRLVPMGGQLVKLDGPNGEAPLQKRASADYCPHCHKANTATILRESLRTAGGVVTKSLTLRCGECASEFEVVSAENFSKTAA
jgi:hypothetical protein